MRVFHRFFKKKCEFHFMRATAITILNGKRETSFALDILFEDVTGVLAEEEVSNVFRPAP